MKQRLELKVNGELWEVFAEPWRTLAEVLRDEVGLMGTKISCGAGDCGACNVILDGKVVSSCLVLAPQAQGKEILTIEGLAGDGGLHPLQEAFIEHFAVQCGYCIPGMIVTAKSFLDENPDASEDEIRLAMSGNLCRCTGYVKMVEAIMAAQEKMKKIAQG